jgi:hypothetical protein
LWCVRGEWESGDEGGRRRIVADWLTAAEDSADWSERVK